MLVSIGKGYYVNTNEVLAVNDATSLQYARGVTEFRNRDDVLDYCPKKKARSVIHLKNGVSILSGMVAATLVARLNAGMNGEKVPLLEEEKAEPAKKSATTPNSRERDINHRQNNNGRARQPRSQKPRVS